jgi:hypothetical protein
MSCGGKSIISLGIFSVLHKFKTVGQEYLADFIGKY